jgi:hypothetical protein
MDYTYNLVSHCETNLSFWLGAVRRLTRRAVPFVYGPTVASLIGKVNGTKGLFKKDPVQRGPRYGKRVLLKT